MSPPPTPLPRPSRDEKSAAQSMTGKHDGHAEKRGDERTRTGSASRRAHERTQDAGDGDGRGTAVGHDAGPQVRGSGNHQGGDERHQADEVGRRDEPVHGAPFRCVQRRAAIVYSLTARKREDAA